MLRPFVAIAAALASAAAANAAEPGAADRQALIELAGRMDREWTAANADGSAELFAPDATARFGDDPLGNGREAIRSQFRSFFTDRPGGLRHVTRIERIEQIAADLALWDAEVHVDHQQPGGEWKTLTRIRNITVAVRRPEGWRVLAVRAIPIAS